MITSSRVLLAILEALHVFPARFSLPRERRVPRPSDLLFHNLILVRSGQGDVGTYKSLASLAYAKVFSDNGLHQHFQTDAPLEQFWRKPEH